MGEILLLSLAAGVLPRGGGGIRSHKCPLAERSPESPKQRPTVSVATGTIPGREVELRIAHVVPGEDREAPGRGILCFGGPGQLQMDIQMNIFILHMKIFLPAQPAFGYCWPPGGAEGLGCLGARCSITYVTSSQIAQVESSF